MNALQLTEKKELFRDSAAFEEFVSWFTSRLQGDFNPVLHDEEIIGAVLSVEASKEFLFDRVAQRLAKSPHLLEEITDRISNDEIVD